MHHLDFNRSNNRHENLLVLERGQHARLHIWLDSGAPGMKILGEQGMNSGKSKVSDTHFCKVCSKTLQDKQVGFCSMECSSFGSRKAVRPDKKELTKLLKEKSRVQLGKDFGVSDNAIKKLATSHGIL